MNIFFPPNQEFVFLVTLILGVFLGMIYDAFSVKRKLICDNFAVCFIDDCLFVFISGILFLICVFITNNGIIRWYEFICCLVGFTIYKCTVSRVVMALMNRIIFIIHNILKFAFKLVLMFLSPFARVMLFPFKLLKKAFYPILQFIIRSVIVILIYKRSISMIKIGK